MFIEAIKSPTQNIDYRIQLTTDQLNSDRYKLEMNKYWRGRVHREVSNFVLHLQPAQKGGFVLWKDDDEGSEWVVCFHKNAQTPHPTVATQQQQYCTLSRFTMCQAWPH